MDASTSFQTATMAYRNSTARPFVPADQGGISMGMTQAKRAAIKHAATDFEAMFMSSMLESMSAGMKPDKMFGGGQAEQMYRSLMNQEYGKAIASKDTLGIAKEVESEMIQIQERSQK
ncbi:MAG TPA: rod-binding protein [Aliidongia sp.]|nr:rod-binding protein [Aliidongia sp.]